jgi:hypothetical protein
MAKSSGPSLFACFAPSRVCLKPPTDAEAPTSPLDGFQPKRLQQHRRIGPCQRRPGLPGGRRHLEGLQPASRN